MPIRERKQSLHVYAWLSWLVASVVVLISISNAIVTTAFVVLTFFIVRFCARRKNDVQLFQRIVFFAIIFGLIRIAIAVLTIHGLGDSIVSLPTLKLPRVLGGFSLGGTIELVVIKQAAIESILLVGVIAAFGVVNALSRPDEWLEFAPRALYVPAIIVAIGVSTLPIIFGLHDQAKEADLGRVGGRKIKKRRWRRRMIPIVDGALEHAMFLGESMDARGFGATSTNSRQRVAMVFGFLALASLVVLSASWTTYSSAIRFGLLLMSGISLFAGLFLAKSEPRKQRVFAKRFGRKDVIEVSLSAACLAVALLISWTQNNALWPAVLLATVALSSPVYLLREPAHA